MLPPDARGNGVAGALSMLKPGPEIESAETETLEDPLFCNVTVNVLVVPTETLPNASVEGEASTATVGPALETETFGGEPAPLVPQPVMEPMNNAHTMTPQNAGKRRKRFRLTIALSRIKIYVFCPGSPFGFGVYTSQLLHWATHERTTAAVLNTA
jgi:hypothetical protein